MGLGEQRRRAKVANSVLGVPALPPSGVTAAVTRLRAAVAVHRESAPPPLQILESVFGAVEHRALIAFCEAGLPDAIQRATTVAELAAQLDLDATRLDRLIRFAAGHGWVRLDRDERVRPNRVTAFLRRDHPGGWRAWVEFSARPEVGAALAQLSAEAGGGDHFAEANGAPFFEWTATHPDLAGPFDAAMAAGGRMHGLALAAALDWSSGERVCDVGGGSGALLGVLLDLLPTLHGTLFDLPGVVAGAISHPRLRVVAGDAFEEVPAGHDTYLLVNVVHDWGDDDAGRILARVAEAATATRARILVVDAERPDRPTADVFSSTDLLMAALTPGGKERTANELLALAAANGLAHVRTHRLAGGDTATELAPG